MNIRKNMKTNTCIVVLIFTLLTVNVFAQNDYKWGEWTTWGDQEDGTYCNPVLPSDYRIIMNSFYSQSLSNNIPQM